ncbi:ATPase involved in chromosome partitioning-like protein [Ammonifex degensii KC4]|uniref:ATPase involved in chromosome partitioning-like protein n=1 Tax=Ammonifex degensii (strain DSM 10501 / KC4) TaxID=429009 RepID=C9RCE5_AMMDK|nr:MinD/ParA family protein [Ammonifex degensii]ACX51922.1 ATPase involved in chromosome partitioning-like protein [Ammonifex degensii KC4]
MKVLVAGAEDFVESCVRRAEGTPVRVVSVATSPVVAADLLLQGGYDAVVLGFPVGDCEALLRECPLPEGVLCLVSLPEVTASDWRRLASLGAAPVRAGSEVDELLRAAPRALPAREEERVPGEFEEFAREDARARVSEVRKQTAAGKAVALKHRVFAFYAPKGGEGKTTLAVAFASSVAKLAGLKVVLLDVDPTREGSDVARRFGYFVSRGVRPPVTLASWRDFPQDRWRLWETVEKYVVPTPVEGLWFLPAPWDVADAEVVTRELVSRVMTVLKRHFDLVVADTSPSLTEGVVEVLDQADVVVLVCRPTLDEADALAGFSRKTVGKLNFPREKIRLVFNLVPPDLPYSTKEVAANAGLVETAAVPFDPTVVRVRSRSEVPDAQLDSPFGRAVYRMVQSLLPAGLLPEEEEKGERRVGFLARLLGRRKARA